MHAGKTGDREKDVASIFPNRNWGDRVKTGRNMLGVKRDWGKNGRAYDIDGYICSQHGTLKEEVVSKTKMDSEKVN